jgi:hypothetical protein
MGPKARVSVLSSVLLNLAGGEGMEEARFVL